MSFDPVAFLEQIVRVPSLSGQEHEVAQISVQAMAQVGLQSQIDGAGNAVGEIGSGPTVVLLGHIDTVPGVVPVRIEDGKLYGRGTVDAKGPFATFVAAAARLAATGDLPFRLVVIGAVEEEAATSKGAHFVCDRYQPIACVIGEPSGWERLTLGYKGRLLLDAHWQQPMAHSAGREVAVSERAVQFWNAIASHCQEFNRAHTRLFDQLLPSLRSINTASNGLDDTAELTVGIRLPPAIDPAELAAQISTFAEASGKPTLHFRDGCRAYQSEKNSPLVRAMIRGIRATGGTAGFVLKTGTSDMNIVGPAWQCPILAYGPGDSNLDHTPNEHVVIDEYLAAIDVLETALRHLGR